MEEAEREEEEEGERESPKELEPEEEEIAMANGAEGLGLFSALFGSGRKKEFVVKKSRFGVRLNSEKMEDGSAVSRFTRSLLQRRCVFFGGCSVFNEH